MKRALLASVFALIGSLSYGLDAYFTFENDALNSAGDNDYTHGTELKLVSDDGWLYRVAQTMYAPSDLKREDHIVGDRPYCGMLIGGIGRELFKDDKSPWTHYAELDFGMIGPAAGCKETQTMVHKLLNCKKPMGWDNQLHNEFVVNGQWWTKYNWYVTKWLAIVPRAGIAAGTIQDFAEVGCDVKLGWNIKPTVNNDIIFSAPKEGSWASMLTAYVFAGVGERFYLYNHILEGSMFGHKDDGLDVDINRFVTEFKFGAVVRYDRLFATYYVVMRTDEFKHQPNSPDYGGLGFGWTF